MILWTINSGFHLMYVRSVYKFSKFEIFKREIEFQNDERQNPKKNKFVKAMLP